MKREFLKQATDRSMKNVDTPRDTKGNYIRLVISVLLLIYGKLKKYSNE